MSAAEVDTTTANNGRVNIGISKAQRERFKRKDRKKRKQEKKKEESQKQSLDASPASQPEGLNPNDIEIEYVTSDPFEAITNPEDGEAFAELKEVISQFTRTKIKPEPKTEGAPGTEGEKKAEPVKEEKLSKKKRKLLRRLPIAVLKQVVVRPDLVEIHDTCAADPFLLMHLKAYHNTVSVPRHWSQKRKYLQGKRGIEKPPFDLPDFIKKTGIMEARSSGIEKDAEKSLKQKARERLNPSMNKIGIDYQVLHDAFFKHQTKPKFTGFGDIYYEGKEFEVEMKEKRPGVLSKELKEALGIPEGAPPPWLINMQRVGPPPAYRNLKIPGLNAPIPPGAEYGYHPGGWGRPPQDENGRPLYVEAWGQQEVPRAQYIESAHWGALPENVQEESSSEEEQKSEEEEERVVDYIPSQEEEEVSGTETPLSGIETPQNMEASLRKTPALPGAPKKVIDDSGDKQLYQVLEEKEAAVSGSELYGSSHTYVIDKTKAKATPGPTSTPARAAGAGGDKVDLMRSQKTESIDIALDPSELATLTDESLKKRFDKAVEDKKVDKSGTSTGSESEGGGKKRKRGGKDDGKKSKKFKEFQF